MIDYSDLEFPPYEYDAIDEVTNPMVCLLKFRELVCPVGYVDKEKMKKLVCDFIDDSGVINFSNKSYI